MPSHKFCSRMLINERDMPGGGIYHLTPRNRAIEGRQSAMRADGQTEEIDVSNRLVAGDQLRPEEALVEQ